MLSSREDDSQKIWVKFWRNSAELLREVVVGHVVTCYAVSTTLFNDQIELTNTDATSIEVTKTSYNFICSMYSRLKANT